jgi:hypothetical protein
MQYLMLTASAPDGEPITVTEEEDLAEIEEWLAYAESKNARVLGNRLRPLSDAVVVRTRKGDVLVTDGPFAEAKEFIGGFDVLQCDSLDVAIDIASRHPAARSGQIEVRPTWPVPGITD